MLGNKSVVTLEKDTIPNIPTIITAINTVIAFDEDTTEMDEINIDDI